MMAPLNMAYGLFDDEPLYTIPEHHSTWNWSWINKGWQPQNQMQKSKIKMQN